PEQGLYGRFPPRAQGRGLAGGWAGSPGDGAGGGKECGGGGPRLAPGALGRGKDKGGAPPAPGAGEPPLDLPPECWPTMYAPPGQLLWLISYPRGEFQSHQSQQPRPQQ